MWQIVPLILAALLLFLVPKSQGASRAGWAGDSSGASHRFGRLLLLKSANCRERDDHRNILRLGRQCEPFGHGRRFGQLSAADRA